MYKVSNLRSGLSSVNSPCHFLFLIHLHICKAVHLLAVSFFVPYLHFEIKAAQQRESAMFTNFPPCPFS